MGKIDGHDDYPYGWLAFPSRWVWVLTLLYGTITTEGGLAYNETRRLLVTCFRFTSKSVIPVWFLLVSAPEGVRLNYFESKVRALRARLLAWSFVSPTSGLPYFLFMAYTCLSSSLMTIIHKAAKRNRLLLNQILATYFLHLHALDEGACTDFMELQS